MEIKVIQPTFGDVEDDVIVPSPIYQVYLVSGVWGEVDLNEVIDNNKPDSENNIKNPEILEIRVTQGIGQVILQLVGNDISESLSYIWNFTLDDTILWSETTKGTSLRISRENYALYNSVQSIELVITVAETDKVSQKFIIK